MKRAGQAASPALVGHDREQRSSSFVNRLAYAVANLSIANQFLLAASIVVFGLMGLFGYFTASQIEQSALAAAGAEGTARMQTTIAPLLRRDNNGQFVFDDQFRQSMNQMVGQGPEGQRIYNIKIWLADGTPVYSVMPSGDEPEHHDAEIFGELAAALRGETIVSRTETDKHHYTTEEQAQVLVEIYAPLLSDMSGRVQLAGEIYLESAKLEEQLTRARIVAMAVAFLVSVPMLSLLYFIVLRGSRTIDAQRTTLRQSLRNAIDLSIENNRLRVMADNARTEAGKLNERILDQIGADLHDGAVQVLTLLKLSLSDFASAQNFQDSQRGSLNKALGLVTSVLDELRNISAGLILPELERATIREAMELAVKRHLEITGCSVKLNCECDCDIRVHDLSICLYRFTLEGLMNSFRHARGNNQLVRCTLRRDRLYVIVADLGRAPDMPQGTNLQRARLGQISQKRRIKSFGGRMRYMPRRNGSIAIASLPINAR